LHVIEDYILDEFGENKRVEFMEEAEKVAIQLESFPKMGKEEPLLAHRKKLYRSYVITHLSKMIYHVDEKRELVVISDVWDTRREPRSVAKGL
jgi:plasmid stabilization system protein ParE